MQAKDAVSCVIPAFHTYFYFAVFQKTCQSLLTDLSWNSSTDLALSSSHALPPTHAHPGHRPRNTALCPSLQSGLMLPAPSAKLSPVGISTSLPQIASEYSIVH